MPHVLLEKFLLGWKDCELEVMNNLVDNGVIRCLIQNITAIGVHVADFIFVAPVRILIR